MLNMEQIILDDDDIMMEKIARMRDDDKNIESVPSF